MLGYGQGARPFPKAPAARDYPRHWTPLHLGKLAVLEDPFGHGPCLLEFRGRGYDGLPGT